MDKFDPKFPNYDDSDYNTNANSYYKDLGRKTKLIKLLAKRIWGYDDEINEYFERWEHNLDTINEDVIDKMLEWLEDGTLEKIINDYVLDGKADKTYINKLNDNIISQLVQKAEQEDVDFVKATKADKKYVETLAQSLASGSPKGTYATYGELADAFPTGNSNIYVVTEDGNWYYWDGSTWVSGGVYQSTAIGEREIGAENTTFIKRGRNLFDVDKVTVGKNINTTTGEIFDNTDTLISDFIPVEQQTYYARKNLCGVIRYYNDREFLSGVVNGTTPINTGVATHVRLVMPLSQVYGQQFQKGETIADDDYGLELANKINNKKVVARIAKDDYSSKKENDLYTSFNLLKNTVDFTSRNAYLTDSYEHAWRTEDKSIKVNTTDVSPAYVQGNFDGVKSIEGISEILLAMYIPDKTAISALEIRLHMTDGSNWTPSLPNDQLEQGWNILRLPATRSTYGNWNNFDYFRIYAYTNRTTEFYVGKMCAVIQNKAKVMIVNDHGYSNFKNVAYPQLKALGIPVTWAINPGRLGGTGGILTEEEIKELANDPYSDINFHAWNPTEQATQFMTADELREDTLKCMRWIQSKGYQPQNWWRSVFVQNEAQNHEAIRDMVEAYSTPRSSAGYDLYPFIDKWNVGRVSLHGRDEAWFDNTFEVLKKTKPLFVLYTHDINETDPIDLPEDKLNYFISKLSTAVDEGWVEGVTYDQLKTRYSRVFDIDDLGDYLDTL